jgi:hypothetical protein
MESVILSFLMTILSIINTKKHFLAKIQDI